MSRNTYVFRRSNGQLITIRANSAYEARQILDNRYNDATFHSVRRPNGTQNAWSGKIDSRPRQDITTDENGNPTPY